MGTVALGGKERCSNRRHDMKIGVIGSGDVAKVLASGFLKHGHDVVIGTRDPAKLNEWAERNAGARVGSFSGAAQFGEVIALAAKGLAAAEALRAAGASNRSWLPRSRTETLAHGAVCFRATPHLYAFNALHRVS